MDRSQPKYHVLIVSINSSIRLEFQSYLHKILGAILPLIQLDWTRSSGRANQGIPVHPFFQPPGPVRISHIHPKEVMQIICTRTFNHACLDQIIRIPPGERVYIVNDTYDSIVTSWTSSRRQVVQYRFEPFYPGCIQADESIHYAITVGEPSWFPAISPMSLISATASLTSPLSMSCASTSSSRQPVQPDYQILCEQHHADCQADQRLLPGLHLFQAASPDRYQQSSHRPVLLSVRGEINMVNRRFSMDLELPETGTTGRNLSQFLPQPCKGMDFCHSADYKVMNRSGKHLLLSSLELLLPNHEPLPAQQHAVSCAG